ncbi:MAG: hypothetical protein IPH22_00930 [Nitrosomonas sp.]|nr:hypothetical protein [Nitrosomonas sp.]
MSARKPHFFASKLPKFSIIPEKCNEDMHSKKLPIAFFWRRSTKNSIFTQHQPLIAHNQVLLALDEKFILGCSLVF